MVYITVVLTVTLPAAFFCDRIEHLENQKIISLCNKCWHDGEQKRSGLNSIVFGRSTASNATVDQRQYRPLARAHQEEKDKGNILFDGNEQCTVRSRGRWSDKASCVLKIHPFAEKENSPIPSWRPLTWEEITVDERFSLYHTQKLSVFLCTQCLTLSFLWNIYSQVFE